MNSNKFDVGSQVLVRTQLKGKVNQVRLGTIVAFKDDSNKVAVVSIANDPRRSMANITGHLSDTGTRKEIPVAQLELSSERYGGRAVVQANPVNRSIGNILR